MSGFCSQLTFPTAPADGRWESVPGAPGWQLRRYEDARDWMSWQRDYDGLPVWLSADYFRMLQHPQGMHTWAVALRHPQYDDPFLLTVQDVLLHPSQQLPMGHRWVFGMADRWRPRVLILGQMLVSGPYGGLHWETLPGTEAASVLTAVGQKLGSERQCRAFVIKDLFAAQSSTLDTLRNRGLHTIQPDPIMQLSLRQFADFEEYLAALTSKYRVRYRRARKKLGRIRRRRLATDNATYWLPRIYDLHRETRAAADYNFVELTPEYWAWLWDRADIHGYFAADELVGFTTGIGNGDVFHAHYLGLREAYKFSHHLYHNMLYDLLGDAIAGGYTTLDYGRTAPEIKSSVGASALDYPVLVRAVNPLLNRIAGSLMGAFYRPVEWTSRNPFRDADG